MMTDDANFKANTRAAVICDSVSPAGNRLTTIEVTFHRFVLAEFNTHRVFSRNSASSRAIPFRKQVERVMNNPAVPVEWRAEQRGMQGGDELVGSDKQDAEFGWIHARNSAVQHAQHLADMGVHKSIVNRILEPFMWHTVIVTATDWDGFWHQRCSPLAQPEIRVAAEAMREAYDNSTPREVQYDDWHLPYIDNSDVDAIKEHFRHESGGRITEALKQVSAARCARVSYLTHDGVRDISKDIELYERLTSADPMHASPLEHVATPARTVDYAIGGVLGNFQGWHQLRHFVELGRL